MKYLAIPVSDPKIIVQFKPAHKQLTYLENQQITDPYLRPPNFKTQVTASNDKN